MNEDLTVDIMLLIDKLSPLGYTLHGPEGHHVAALLFLCGGGTWRNLALT